MSKPVLYAVRFLMIAVVLAALSLLAAASSHQGSPYLSALATVASPSSTMAATCSNSSCGRDKEGTFICAPTTASNCNRNHSGHNCSTTAC